MSKKTEHPSRSMRRQVEHFDRMVLREMLSRFIDNGDGTFTIPKPRRYLENIPKAKP